MVFGRQRSSGFTLVEVMIALVILAIGLLGIATLQIVSIRGNAFSSEMTYAAMLAQERLEILRNLIFTATATDPDLAAGPHALPPAVGDKGVSYTVSWNVTDDPSGEMKTVSVTITWTGAAAAQASQQYTPTFTTIIAER